MAASIAAGTVFISPLTLTVLEARKGGRLFTSSDCDRALSFGLQTVMIGSLVSVITLTAAIVLTSQMK